MLSQPHFCRGPVMPSRLTPRDRVEKPGPIIGRIYGYLGVDPAALMAKTPAGSPDMISRRDRGVPNE
jgi:hypothetical protein